MCLPYDDNWHYFPFISILKEFIDGKVCKKEEESDGCVSSFAWKLCENTKEWKSKAAKNDSVSAM